VKGVDLGHAKTAVESGPAVKAGAVARQ
jgi:hypothetical protein